jgi:hypothetical protein
MAHGYLGDGYGTHGEIDPGSGDDRDRRERGWRGRDEDWRDRDRDRSWHDRDRDRGMMFGDRSDEGRWSGWNRDRESFGREHGYGGFQGDYGGGREQGGFGGRGDWERGRQSFSAHPDDHYRSWRDRHMSELDRDYRDYCREREQQFHRDFDDWRRQKYGNPQPLRTGMTQSGISHDPSGMDEAAEDRAPMTASQPDPTADATLGTNSSGGARSRRG